MWVLRSSTLAASALTLALALGACGGNDTADGGGGPGGGEAPGTAQTAAPGQKITIGATAEPSTMDPHKVSDPVQNYIIWEVYEALTAMEGAKVVPLLASQLPEQIEDDVWEVKLREGVKFSNGRPFTADDVVYSLERIISPEVATTVPESQQIKSTRKVDDHTVRITTKGEDPLLANKLAAIKILPKGQAKDLDKPVGTGPYKVVSIRRGQEARITYNEAWRGDKPQVTDVTIRFIPDSATRMRALEAGEVDIVPDISPSDIGTAPEVTTSKDYVKTMWLRLNSYKPPLDDVHVRQGINYAIDKQAITDNLFPDGTATPVNCQIGPPQTVNASKTLKPYPYDPGKARELFTQAGATDEQLTLFWPSGAYPLDREVGQAIAQNLNDAGLKVKLQFKDNTANLKDVVVVGKDANHFTAAASADSLGNISRLVQAFYPSDGGNSAYADPKMDRLFARASSLPLGEERQAAFEEVLDYGCEQGAMAFLYTFKDIYGVQENIEYQPIAPSFRPNWSLVRVVET